MKKSALIALIMLAFAFTTKAQNQFNFTINDELCLDEVTLNYSDETSETLPLGCETTYSFDIGNLSIKSITINEVVCYPQTTTEVLANEKKRATVKVIQVDQTKLDGILNLIR